MTNEDDVPATLETVLWQRGEFEVSTDKSRLDVALIHSFLNTETFWAADRSYAEVEATLRNSVVFGIYDKTTSEMCGSARVVTDFVSFAWLADVFVIDKYKGRGLGLWLSECVVDHPALKDVKRWLLATETASDLYKSIGFTYVPDNKFMVRLVTRDA